MSIKRLLVISISLISAIAMLFAIQPANVAKADDIPAINHGVFGGAPYNLEDADAVSAYKNESLLIQAGGYISDTEYKTMEEVLISFDDNSTYVTDRGGCIYIQTVINGLHLGDIVEVDNDYLYRVGLDGNYESFWNQDPYWFEISDYTHSTSQETINNWLTYSEKVNDTDYRLVIGSGEYNLALNDDDLTTIIGDAFKLIRDIKIYRGAVLENPATSSRGYKYSNSEDTSGWAAPILVDSLDTGALDIVGVQESFVNDDWAGSSNGDVVDDHIFGQDAFNSVQTAINGTVNGGIVNIMSGIYNETPNIDRSITMRAITRGDFSSEVPISDSQETGYWYTDRFAPAAFESFDFNGELVLRQGILAADEQSSAFYNTQGRKLDTNLTGASQSMTIDMWVGEDWDTQTRYAGLWATGFDATDSVSAYPIIAWRNAEGDGPGFFAYDYITGDWIKLRDANEDDYGSWHSIGFTLNVGNGVDYFVDDVHLLEFADPDTLSLANVILNVKNYGEDYDVYWDNFRVLSDDPATFESAIIGQTTITADFVYIDGLFLSNPSGPYGVLINSPSVGPAHHDFGFTNNKFQNIGGPETTANIKGLYFPEGADNILIETNLFNNIRSGMTKSVTAVNNGDSTSTDPSENVVILHNNFMNISSEGKGAYGILLNNGAGAPGAQIAHNSFSNIISGGWTHAIGLEGPSLNAVVVKNTFDNLMAGGVDNAAVFFEDNTYGETVTLAMNQFNQDSFFGVAIHVDDQEGGVNGLGYFVNASPNWWSSNAGPSETQIFGNIGYTPWCALPDCSILNPNSIPAGTPGDEVQEILDRAPDGTTIIFEGSPQSYPGGYIINNPNLTIILNDGTVIENDSPCFVINADYTTIKTASPLGATCIPTNGSNGIDVNGTRTNIVIEGLAFDGSDGDNGIYFADEVNDLVISDNYFHSFGNAGLYFMAEPVGTVQIQGNLFKDNAGLGIDSFGVYEIPAQYNSWGSFDGPAAGDGVADGVQAEPFTHVDLYIESWGTDYPNRVYLNEEITFDVYANMVNAMGADVVLNFPPELDVLDITPQGNFDIENVSEGTDTIHFYGYQSANDALTTNDTILFSVAFEGVSVGKDLTLAIDESSDVFSMAPGYGPSTNIYAAELDGVYDAEVDAYPTMDIIPAGGDYIAGLPIEFSVEIDNTNGGQYDFLALHLEFPGDAIMEMWDGSGWVPYSDPVDPGALAPNAIETVAFRVIFHDPGVNNITAELFDTAPVSNPMIALASEDFTTLGEFDVAGTVSMQGRTVRSGVPLKLASMTAPHYADNDVFSTGEISNNILFAGVNGGTYRVTTNQARYLNIFEDMGRLIAVSDDYVLPELELKGGNAVWTDNIINIQDASEVGSKYGTGTIADDADVNFDDRVNIQDLALVGGNFDLTSEVAYAEWLGQVAGVITTDENTGQISGSISGDFDITIDAMVTGENGNFLTFSGTVSGDINGNISGTVNAGGIDTMYGVITDSGIDGSVRIFGTFPQTGIAGDFVGSIFGGPERSAVTSVTIDGPASVAVGETIDLDAIVTPAGWRPELWSVYVDDASKVDVNMYTGEVTGENEGTAIIYVKILDDSNVSEATITITVTP